MIIIHSVVMEFYNGIRQAKDIRASKGNDNRLKTDEHGFSSRW